MAALKPAYLVCGEDHAKIDAWRARVRRRAEEENGPGGLEAFDATTDPPEAVAASLAALTFGGGTRYVMVDGVESWKPAALDTLERELKAPPPDTVLVLVARGKAPDRLREAVEKAGGELREYEAPKPRALPRWVVERAADEGLQLDPDAARTLVAIVGSSQQRLQREVERLALLAHPHTTLNAEQIRRAVSGEASGQGYELADALVAGDLEQTLRLAERLVEQGDRPGRLVYPILSGLRRTLRAAELVDAGVSESQLAKELRTPPWLAKRIASQARRADRERLERALCAFADLEIRMRNGECVDDESGLTLALAKAAA
ncbi:MAG: DNA polymerase III subunit delta [Actinomycetota bacterium]|nr:DNA polymerase III subunit delta [Actinomycetota bacterium]